MLDSTISFPPSKSQFASDNTSGICPEAWEAMQRANEGHVFSYGNDAWTERASNLLREFFESDCEVFFVFNGTAANSLALAACCQSYHSVICHEQSHIQQDECGAPEFFSNGTKLQSMATSATKLTPDVVHSLATRRTDLHYPKARVISVTQSSEFGTVYTACELHELSEAASTYGLSIHMDGARIIQAIASLDVAPKSITWQAGVDVLCCGGVKAGGTAEAVIFFNRDLARDFEYRCKQAGQLASKMRFLSSTWVGLLEDQAWLKHAKHSNALAKSLAKRLTQEANLTLAHPVEANAVFVHFPPPLAAALRESGWVFYDFIGGAARLMCSWKTTPSDIDLLIADILRCQKVAKNQTP